MLAYVGLQVKLRDTIYTILRWHPVVLRWLAMKDLSGFNYNSDNTVLLYIKNIKTSQKSTRKLGLATTKCPQQTNSTINLFWSMWEWVSEQCFTSPPTQYRLYGRRFLQVKRPNQQYQSTEGIYSTSITEKHNNRTINTKHNKSRGLV